MNKKLVDFFAERGMSVNGNNAYGIVSDYEVNFIQLNADLASSRAEYPYQFHFSFYATEEQKRDMKSMLKEAKIKRCQYRFTDYGFLLTLTDVTVGKLVDRLPEVFDTVRSMISNYGGLTYQYCPKCGKELADNKYEMRLDSFTITIDNECRDSINAAIEAENKAFEEAPNNFLRGFAGAAVGGAAGVVVAIILYWLGYFTSIAAIVSIVVGTLLYQKFGGKPTKLMIPIVVGTTFVFMALSVFLIYFIGAGLAAAEAGLDMSAMEAFKIIMQDEEIAQEFYLDLGLMMLFTVIGVAVEFAYIARQTKRSNKI